MACFKLKHFRHQIFGRGPCRKSPPFSARARAENLLPEISNRKCAISGSARNPKILKTEKGQKKVWNSGSSRNGLRVGKPPKKEVEPIAPNSEAESQTKYTIYTYIGIPIQVKNKINEEEAIPPPYEAGECSSSGSRRPDHPPSTPWSCERAKTKLTTHVILHYLSYIALYPYTVTKCFQDWNSSTFGGY